MAAKVLTNAYIYLNGASNVSGFATKVELNVDVVELDSTTFGSGWTTNEGGLKSGSISIDFLDDYTASTGLDAILWPLLGSSVAFEIRTDSGTVSTSNPKWTGNVRISKLPAISGGVGELAKKSVTWPANGAVTRATS